MRRFLEGEILIEASEICILKDRFPRLDYILFLQDLLEADRANRVLAGQDVHDDFTGLDIGIGSSAVYPLLFCRLDDNVRMYGAGQSLWRPNSCRA
jgi:23S rRNA A1618 N6-methylase RlmF